MERPVKYDKILDALQELLQDRNIKKISVSDIAKQAGIGKGSIYYYFSSKDAIVDALIERSYKKPLETAVNLAKQTHISPFTRMAMIFQACRYSSTEFLKNGETTYSTDSISETAKEQAYMHQQFLKHLISELTPTLSEIISQGISQGDINFEYPKELAEIVLIVLSVKLNNTLAPSSPAETEKTLRALISLLEKGTQTPLGALDYLAVIQ